MSFDRERERAPGCELSHFERNRYFHGKLMTARDMQAEQDYHAGRLNTLARSVMGEGIVCGLNTAVEDADDEIEITVEPGIALDSCGRPVVVEDAVTRSRDAPSRDEIYVFLSNQEASKDRVPVPGADHAYEEDCTYNRILETFEVTYRETPPNSYKTVPDVEFPSGEELADTDGAALVELARSYHRQHLEQCETSNDRAVFLGSFEKRSGAWHRREADTEPRPYVYTNNMLYAAIADHVADQGNPHDVSVEGISDELLDRLDELESTGDLVSRVDELEERLDALAGYKERLDRLESQKSSLERYVMYKTLDYKVRAYSGLAEEFDSDKVRDVVRRAKGAIADEAYGAFEEEDGYFDRIKEVSDLESDVVDEVEGEATDDSLEEYSTAVDELMAVIEAEEDVIRVAIAQDRVCGAAEGLQELDIVRD